MLTAVIGANYGDEGKGLMTDYLSDASTLVVRFNGGAQAGHTVVTQDGRQHVFKHVGSGTFRGAATLLSRYFLVNPAIFQQELQALKPCVPRVYVDGLCPVTTPWDMLLNRAVEAKRGDKRHGSCGLGINETVHRMQHGPELHVLDLLHGDEVRRAQLARIQKWAVTTRAKELSVELGEEATAPYLVEGFLAAIDKFWSVAQLMDGRDLLAKSPRVVFEGAQGLRLDEHAPGFPHVTRSRTGLTNVMLLLSEAGVSKADPLHVVYVTRAYLTRHGAGPLKGEVEGHPYGYGWTGTETNVTNEYQGHFRYARLDPLDLRKAIRRDIFWVTPGREVLPELAVTCLDQMPMADSAKLLLDLDEHVADVRYASFGPTREDVRELPQQADAEVHSAWA